MIEHLGWTTVRIGLGAVFILVLLVLETLRPLRAQTQPRWRRIGTNLAFAATSSLALAATFKPVVFRALELARDRDAGLLRWTHAPSWLAIPLGVLLLDYTLWVWHLLNHRVPFLWRFHAAHHADVDMDASTALRFHFAELLLSVPYRALQVLAIGADLETLLVFETLLLLATEFHHSNVRLPVRLERLLWLALVTPRIHATHHSVDAAETSSNFGTLSTLWDRLHGTLLAQSAQERLAIGLPEIRERLRPFAALALPFRRRAPAVPVWPASRVK